MEITAIKEIKETIVRARNDAQEFFKKAQLELKQKDLEKHGWYEDRDYYWSQISETLQKDANHIIIKLIKDVMTITAAVKASPLLTEADERDVSFSVKGIRAALQLRRFAHWDTDVLHDEGTVLGVRPSGQSDDDPLSPEEALKTFEYSFEKLSGIVDLITASETDIKEQIISSRAKAVSGYRPNTAFIMMWMDPTNPELVDVSDVIKNCFSDFGIEAVRADDIEHEGLITKKILDEIKTSEFLLADLTGERPSVYYEVGYAHAIGRRVILFRKKNTSIHFDLAGYNCPEYENLRDLKQKLKKRLGQVTGRKSESEGANK